MTRELVLGAQLLSHAIEALPCFLAEHQIVARALRVQHIDERGVAIGIAWQRGERQDFLRSAHGGLEILGQRLVEVAF